MARKTIIIGIGNSDPTEDDKDANLFKIIESLCNKDKSIKFVNSDILSFTLLSYFDDCDNLILIDSSNLNSDSGNIQLYVNSEVEQFLDFNLSNSLHDINLIDLLSIARLANRYPRQLALIATQSNITAWEKELNSNTENIMPAIGEHVNSLLGQWKNETVKQYSCILA